MFRLAPEAARLFLLASFVNFIEMKKVLFTHHNRLPNRFDASDIQTHFSGLSCCVDSFRFVAA